MDYSRFKPKFQIDFIEITFRTPTRTNLKTVQPKLSRILNLPEGRKASVFVLDETAGASASVFAFRIQNPKSKAEVFKTWHALKRRFSLAAEPTFTALEVAFDLQRRTGTTDDELAGAVAHLYKFADFHPHASNHRIYTAKWAQEVPAMLGSLGRYIAAGWCIGVGSHRPHVSMGCAVPADPIAARYYLKRTDDGADLAKHLWSARAERTLQGAAMPFTTLEEFEQFDLSGLKDMFSFRRLKEGLNPLVAPVFRDYALTTFERRTRNRREGGTRQHHPATLADSALNELVRRACRSFSKQWQKSACGNSANPDQPTQANADTGTTSANTYNNQTNNNHQAPHNNREDQIITGDADHVGTLVDALCGNSVTSSPRHPAAIAVRYRSANTYLNPLPCFPSHPRPTPLQYATNNNENHFQNVATINNWKLFELFAAQAP